MIKPNVCNPVVDEKGNLYKSIAELSRKINVWAGGITKAFNNRGYFEKDGIKYFLANNSNDGVYVPSTSENLDGTVQQPIIVKVKEEREDEEEYQEYLRQKSQIGEIEALPFESYEFKFNEKLKERNMR